MEIKRYRPCVDVGAFCDFPGMEESESGEYYSRADLIAAGVLVPVPDGEVCYPGETAETHCLHDGKLCAIISRCGGFVWLREVGRGPDDDFHISSCTKIEPVRFVSLEDVG